MKRDPLFFRLFKELPGCFFQLVGRSAARCATLHPGSDRIQGHVRSARRCLPAARNLGDDPAYLWEAQFYASEKVYANLLSKIGRFLEHGNAEQDWVAVVIYPNRELEQKNLHPYRCLLESDQLVRIYLDELPPRRPINSRWAFWNSSPPSRRPRSKKPRRWCPACASRNNRSNFNERCYN